MYRIELLGGFNLYRDGETITRFDSRKTAALLAYLAYFPRRTHPREVLLEMLWPDVTPDAARHSLSQALFCLRRLLEPPDSTASRVLITDRVSVRLQPGSFTSDAGAFETAAVAASRDPDLTSRVHLAEEALALYSGELLPGFFESWVVQEQPRLLELYQTTLSRLVIDLESVGQFDRALVHARHGVGIDPLREEAHVHIIRLAGLLGQPNVARRQFLELTRILREELGAEPSAATVERLRQAELAAKNLGSSQGFTATPVAAPVHGPRGSKLVPVGGAESLDSPFYVSRPGDAACRAAISRGDSIVLVKGAHQTGKTSLLARAAEHARGEGFQVVVTHCQLLNQEQLGSPQKFVETLTLGLVEKLELDLDRAALWDARYGPILNFRRFVRNTLAESDRPLLWVLDEVDRLFQSPFSTEVFSLFRSWHNERALEPSGPWRRLTLAIAYATEAHLMVSDLNHSPFNVGTRLELGDFTPAQVEDLNLRHGRPLAGEHELYGLTSLVGGHPYLIRRALLELADSGIAIGDLLRAAELESGPFTDYLQRALGPVLRDADLCTAVRDVLDGRGCRSEESFFRLRSAGVLMGETMNAATIRCRLYARYLERALANAVPG